jgi:hypothetical protein
MSADWAPRPVFRCGWSLLGRRPGDRATQKGSFSLEDKLEAYRKNPIACSDAHLHGLGALHLVGGAELAVTCHKRGTRRCVRIRMGWGVPGEVSPCQGLLGLRQEHGKSKTADLLGIQGPR